MFHEGSPRPPMVERKEAPRQTQLPDTLYRLGDQISWKRILGLSGALLAASPEGAEAKPHESLAESKERIEHAIRWEIPAEERAALVGEVGEDRVATYERIVAEFPVEKFVETIAILSDVESQTLLRNLDVERIFPYTERTVAETLDTNVIPYTPETSWTSQLQATFAQEMRHPAGATLYNDRTIGINIGALDRMAQEMGSATGLTKAEIDGMYAAHVEHTLAHELVHAMDEHDTNLHDDETQIESYIYEGLVDAITCQALEPTSGAYHTFVQKYPLLTGYVTGSKAAGRLLLLGLGPTEVARDILTGKRADLSRRLDTKYGAGTWSRIAHYQVPFPEDHRFVTRTDNILPLWALMNVVPDAPAQVAEINRTWKRAGIIPLTVDNALIGVAVRDLDSDIILNGLAIMKAKDGTQIVASNALDMNPERMRDAYGNEVWAGGFSVKGTKGVSNEEVGATIVQQLKTGKAHIDQQQ